MHCLLAISGVFGTTFTFSNKCDHTVWPGILGSPALDTTGFELAKGKSRSLQAPAGWSGRLWGRTGCKFDGLGHGSCATGDCGSGQVECKGAGAAPPATLAEFTLGSGSGTQDFYDVSLVDGYNIQMIVEVRGGSGGCETTGCVDDLNRRCPSELRVADGGGCKSACETFGTPEYCCKGAFGTPAACQPTPYSELFKSACPKSYSYAFDDATSTFTCMGADDYTLVFCPSTRSQASYEFVYGDSKRYIHRYIVTIISGRGQSQEWVTTTNLFYLHSLIAGRPCNLARCFALYCTSFYHQQEHSTLWGDAFVTYIASSRGMVEMLDNLPAIEPRRPPVSARPGHVLPDQELEPIREEPVQSLSRKEKPPQHPPHVYNAVRLIKPLEALLHQIAARCDETDQQMAESDRRRAAWEARVERRLDRYEDLVQWTFASEHARRDGSQLPPFPEPRVYADDGSDVGPSGS
ncbi:hypothetical protein R6Q57_001459 [Mikania cordata]